MTEVALIVAVVLVFAVGHSTWVCLQKERNDEWV